MRAKADKEIDIAC